MSASSLSFHLKKLMTGDTTEWRYLPYRLGMRWRGIDLAWSSAAEMGLAPERSNWHSNSGGPDLDVVLKSLPISASDAAIDIGCGRGGAMLTLSRYPFSEVNGIEISPKLAEIARMNLAKLHVEKAVVICCDAADFTDLDRYTYLYMYNPFPDIIMRQVMENVAASLKRRKRTVVVIYKNPVYEALVVGVGFRKIRHYPHCTPGFTLFSSDIAQ
jgi:hypothetical protein